MNIIKAIIFGIIEGITEWLPISSTGHLILAEAFMKFQNLSEGFWQVFEVVIQLGAILAVVLLYFKNIWPLKKDENKKIKLDKNILNLWGKIIVACLPAILIVLLGIDEIAEAKFYNPTCIAIMLILVGIAFIIIESKFHKKTRVENINELTYKDAIIIGLFQIIAAIFPRNIKVWRNNNRCITNRNIKNSCSRIHVLFSNTSYGRCKFVENTKIWL